MNEHLAALERILSGQSDVVIETLAPVVAASVDIPYKAEPQTLSDEALREFLVECFDNLDQVERDLILLERDPKSEFVLNSVFRNIHTIKGSAGFLAYATLERVAHATENVLGSVDLQSNAGLGTTVKIKIPLTLAIIPALIVTSDSDRYAIPQVNLLELVRLEGEQTRKGIEWIQGAPVYRLRGRLLPLVNLRHELGIDDETKNPGDGVVNIVVLRADDRQFGLIVDRINDSEGIVVKPLSKPLKNVSVYSGTTIMGDGRVALILDVMGLAHSAHVVSGVRDRTLTDSTDRNSNKKS